MDSVVATLICGLGLISNEVLDLLAGPSDSDKGRVSPITLGRNDLIKRAKARKDRQVKWGPAQWAGPRH